LPATAWLVRVSSVLLLCYASWLSRSNTGENLSDRQRFEIAAMFLLLACAISPYSWLHSWVLSAPAVVVFCQRAWELRADVVEIVLLTTFLISLSTNSFHVPTLTPLFGIGLGIYGLYRLRLERAESCVCDQTAGLLDLLVVEASLGFSRGVPSAGEFCEMLSSASCPVAL